MKLAVRVLASLVLSVCSGMIGSAPINAENPCPSVAPSNVAAVRGNTWIGTVVAAHPTDTVDADGLQHWLLVFAVDTVLSTLGDNQPAHATDLVAGTHFSLPSTNCTHPGDLGLAVGDRYLVSTGQIGRHGTLSQNEIAWMIDNGRASVVDYYDVGHLPAALSSVRNVGDLVALLAPSKLPPTTSSQADDRNASEVVPLAVTWLGVFGVAMVIPWRRRTRLR